MRPSSIAPVILSAWVLSLLCGFTTIAAAETVADDTTVEIVEAVKLTDAADTADAADAATTTEAPVSTAFAPENCRSWLQCPDVNATWTRFAASPYAQLLSKPWAQWLCAKADQIDAHFNFDLATWLPLLRNSSYVTIAPLGELADDPLTDGWAAWVFSGTGNRDHLQAVIPEHAIPTWNNGTDWWLSPTTTISHQRHGNWMIAATDYGLPLNALSVTAALPATSSDVALHLDAHDALIFGEQYDDMDLSMRIGDFQTCNWSLGPAGIEESSHQHFGPLSNSGLVHVVFPHAPRERIENLPADTLWACAAGMDFAAYREAFKNNVTTQDQQPLIDAFAKLGIGDLATILAACDGDAVMWCRPSAPWPTLTLDTSCSTEAAHLILGALRDHAGLEADGDDRVSGMLQVISLEATYAEGRLRLTTDPFGFDQACSGDGRFGDDPAIQQAMRHWHPDAYIIGASRSKPSWAALGGLAQLGLLTQNMHEFATLASDLHQAATFGYYCCYNQDSDIYMESGGLFGGPITWIGAGATFGLGYLGHIMQQLEQPVQPR